MSEVVVLSAGKVLNPNLYPFLMTIKKIFLLLIIEKKYLGYLKKFMKFMDFQKKKFFIKVTFL